MRDSLWEKGSAMGLPAGESGGHGGGAYLTGDGRRVARGFTEAMATPAEGKNSQPRGERATALWWVLPLPFVGACAGWRGSEERPG